MTTRLEILKRQLATNLNIMVAQSRIERLVAVVSTGLEWRASHEWAKQNPEKMLSSRMNTSEAADVMREYFTKEQAHKDALAYWLAEEEQK